MPKKTNVNFVQIIVRIVINIALIAHLVKMINLLLIKRKKYINV